MNGSAREAKAGWGEEEGERKEAGEKQEEKERRKEALLLSFTLTFDSET